jgi:type VI secretion system secreted protein VgrG
MTDLSDIRSAVGAAAQDLVDGLLNELGSLGPNQHTRLLRLHTPLGADVLLAERARITEGIGPDLPGGFAIDMLALSTRTDLDADALVGQPVLLELLTSQSLTQLRPFHGHVLTFERLGSDGGLARYRLQIGAWLDVLRHRVDAWVFQDQSVIQITEAILADYASQGALQPRWRWDLQQPDAYPVHSTLSQYNERDFDFLQRLWAMHGLFYWFEHTGQPGEASLGCHTLVIADHNGAFRANVQPRIRFTQAGPTLCEDSITQWHGQRRLGVTSLQTASFDYRTLLNHSASAEADAAHAQPMPLVHTDQPGAYAYETPQEADRLAMVQLQSLQAQRKRFIGRGTVRTLAPATTFVLADHAEHDADIAQAGDDASRFVVLQLVHQARNNLRADAQAGLQALLGHALLGGAHTAPGHAADNASAEPLYEVRFTAQRAAVPYRARLQDDSGRLLLPKPIATGTQTALVVGLDDPIHTDRDGRVKVQFHWQRGANSSHRLDHPGGDNAPASDASGTWLRVAQSWAGANWGQVMLPRLGQEVVVAFIEGDIDRPVVIGATYNGQGQADAQGNDVAAGAAGATGNAPAWFPGEAGGHAHGAVLSGIKSQSLDASQSGAGDYNQLVMDDTPGQGRVLLHTTQSQTWLQIGHLLQQSDNQRLASRGHGLELNTQAQGAVRAGSGLHIATHARAQGSGAGGQPMDTREAQSQLQDHADLLQALNDNARVQRAALPGESGSLPALDGLRADIDSLAHSEANGASPSDAGGQGCIAATLRPDLVLNAAADIGSATPQHTLLHAEGHGTVTAGQDINLLAQADQVWAVKDGISLFTRGEAKDRQRAVQDTGLKLHAASGNVNVQAQSGPFSLTAQQAIDLQSTTADIVISAPSKLLLNGGGSYIRIDGGNIEIGTNGPASFKASMKELAGGGSAVRDSLHLPRVSDLTPSGAASPTIFGEALDHSAVPDAWLPFRLGANTTVFAGSRFLSSGLRLFSDRPTIAVTTNQSTNVSYWQRHDGPAWHVEETIDIASMDDVKSEAEESENDDE